MHIKIIFIFFLTLLWYGISTQIDGAKLIIFNISAPLIAILYSWNLGIIPAKNKFKIFEVIKYFFWLYAQIFLSALSVSRLAWRRNIAIKPVLHIIQTKQSFKEAKVLYANSITLTPGTVSISEWKDNLLVHALDVSYMDDLKEGVMDDKVGLIMKKKEIL